MFLPVATGRILFFSIDISPRSSYLAHLTTIVQHTFYYKSISESTNIFPGYNDSTPHSQNYEKHAPRVSQVIAVVAKVSCKHGL